MTEESNEQPPTEQQQLEQLLEGLRRTGLVLDREGRWWHQGTQVTHRRLALALSCWLDRLDDGRYILRLDAERYAYVEVEDAPFQALTMTPAEDGLLLTLSDGSQEPLDGATLAEGPQGALYCRVKGGRFWARFSRIAQQHAAPLVEETPAGFALRVAGKSWAIGQRRPPQKCT